MADIAPFVGLRYTAAPAADLARVLAPPYDVIGDEERQALEARHPENIVRLELPRGAGDARYATAARLLDGWIAEGILAPDPAPAFYVYEQRFTRPPGTLGGGRSHVRRGFFAAVRLEPFERRVVLPHEHTLSGPKEDRRRLLRACRTQLSPIFGLYRDPGGAAAAVLDAASTGAPAVDATTADGVNHRMWLMTDAAAVATLARQLRDRQILIADGHHRYETMLGLAPELRPLDAAAGTAPSDFTMMYLARAEDPGLLVLPTHRLVKDLPDFDVAGLRAAAAPAFDVSRGDEATAEAIEARLARAREQGGVTFALRVPGEAETTWFALRSYVDLSALGPPALRRLDVTVLHGVILGTLLGIDEAALANQSYLAYTHDTAEALARVARGDVQAAWIMNPTSVDEVLTACEAGFVLPQKSTYFQPKLATGMVMYPLTGPAPRVPT